MTKIQIAILAVAAGFAMQARAALYDITYSDPAGNMGSGVVTALPNGDGSYTAVSGSFNLTAGDFAGATGALVPNPNAPAPWDQRLYGGTDFIGLDDQVLPSANPFLTIGGLLFNDTLFPRPDGAGLAFNLYYYSGSYQLAVNGFNNEPWANNYSGGSASLTVVPVPEASTIVAGALLLLPFGVSVVQVLRKNRAA
jgi:hypothetical protein